MTNLSDELMRWFRQGQDSFDLARRTGLSEAEVVRILAAHREARR